MVVLCLEVFLTLLQEKFCGFLFVWFFFFLVRQMHIFIKHLNRSFLLKCLAALHNIFIKGGLKKSFHASFFVILLHKWGVKLGGEGKRAQVSCGDRCDISWACGTLQWPLHHLSLEALEMLPSQKTFGLVSQESFAPCRIQCCFSVTQNLFMFESFRAKAGFTLGAVGSC